MSERYRVPALVSAAAILDAISRADGEGLTHGELVRDLGLSKSSAHNLLATLVDLGWLRRDPRRRAYRLGGALVRLGAVAAARVDALGLAMERTDALANEHSLTVGVTQMVAPDTVELVKVSYPDDFHVGVVLGARYGYFDGAVGKVLLAQHDPETARRIVRERGERLPAHTERTLTDPDCLLAEVDAVRQKGYATSIGEYRHNNAVAVPVRDAGGELAALLLTIGFPDQLTPEAIPSIGHVLMDVADAVTAECGGRAPAERTQRPTSDTAEPATKERR
jgi:IclR family acetate operon transcriptional repressor